MDDWGMVFAAREDLASLADGLSAEQWDVQSLCDEWKVRHVVAHVALTADESLLGFLPVLLKSGFNVNKAISRTAIEHGDKMQPEEIVKSLREKLEARKTPPGVKVRGVLADVVTHTSDIRRPLGLPLDVPSDRLIASLDEFKGMGSILGNKKRVGALRLVATDIDWSTGEGPEVRGTGEALLMAMCGRKSALADLEGPGVEALKTRS